MAATRVTSFCNPDRIFWNSAGDGSLPEPSADTRFRFISSLAFFADWQSCLSLTASAASALGGAGVGEAEVAVADGTTADGEAPALGVASSPPQAVSVSNEAQARTKKEARTRFTSVNRSGFRENSLALSGVQPQRDAYPPPRGLLAAAGTRWGQKVCSGAGNWPERTSSAKRRVASSSVSASAA
ncbi:hypothetical protein Van01_55960 [Micromonospora andamanensis]|uniref:Uncharacterized protein n=1 Tax=Micromonospora andamanensis TaxID=1287068 RepID=A0ABQ4I3B4_9ACTN|nr:hypothetical protein Van01_55960 [Micromonospora andamanensis]